MVAKRKMPSAVCACTPAPIVMPGAMRIATVGLKLYVASSVLRAMIEPWYVGLVGSVLRPNGALTAMPR